MSANVNCPNCGAALTGDGLRVCGYCETEIPPAPVPVFVERSVGERLAAVRRHPRFAALMRHQPDDSSLHTRLQWQSVFGWGFAAFASLILCFGGAVAFLVVSAFDGAGRDLERSGGRSPSGWIAAIPFVAFIAVPAGFVVIGVMLARNGSKKRARLRRAGVERHVAAVIDERTHVSGGEHASTTYYALLQFEDGARQEWRVASKFAGSVAAGDVGVAYLKDGYLLEFARLDV